MGPRLLSLPQTQRWMGNPTASPDGFREDDGPKGPRPPWLLGLVRRYKASTHQTHSRVVTTQLIFKTSVYVLCAPPYCKPPPPSLGIQGAQAVNLCGKEQRHPLLLPRVDLGCIFPGIPSTAVSLLPFISTYNSSWHWQLRSEWDEEEAVIQEHKHSTV